MLEHHEQDPGPTSEQLDQIFKALAHPVRRSILARTGERPHTISELAQPFDMTLEGVSQHVRVLEGAGLIGRTRDGRSHYCTLHPKPLAEATRILQKLARFWNVRLDGLERILDEGVGL